MRVATPCLNSETVIYTENIGDTVSVCIARVEDYPQKIPVRISSDDALRLATLLIQHAMDAKAQESKG